MELRAGSIPAKVRTKTMSMKKKPKAKAKKVQPKPKKALPKSPYKDLMDYNKQLDDYCTGTYALPANEVVGSDNYEACVRSAFEENETHIDLADWWAMKYDLTRIEEYGMTAPYARAIYKKYF